MMLNLQTHRILPLQDAMLHQMVLARFIRGFEARMRQQLQDAPVDAPMDEDDDEDEEPRYGKGDGEDE